MGDQRLRVRPRDDYHVPVCVSRVPQRVKYSRAVTRRDNYTRWNLSTSYPLSQNIEIVPQRHSSRKNVSRVIKSDFCFDPQLVIAEVAGTLSRSRPVSRTSQVV